MILKGIVNQTYFRGAENNMLIIRERVFNNDIELIANYWKFKQQFVRDSYLWPKVIWYYCLIRMQRKQHGILSKNCSESPELKMLHIVLNIVHNFALKVNYLVIFQMHGHLLPFSLNLLDVSTIDYEQLWKLVINNFHRVFAGNH